MTEQNLWRYLRPRLEPFGRLKRIENSTENGTPDLYYLLRGYPGWVELKFRPNEPARATTPVTFDHLTIDQVNWLEEEHRHGGRASILMQVERHYMIIGTDLVRPLYERRLTLMMLKTKALYHTIGMIRPAEMVRCLTRPVATSPF